MAEKSQNCSVSYRVMAEGDLEAVLGIEQACFSTPWSQSNFETALRHPSCHTVTARIETELVGYLVAFLHEETVLIANVAVRPGFRRIGVASHLIRDSLEEAKARGAAYAVLDVRKSNRGAIRLYQQLGFHPVGERCAYYSSPVEDSLTMGRRLPGYLNR